MLQGLEAPTRRKLPAAVQQMLAHEAELEGMRQRHQAIPRMCMSMARCALCAAGSRPVVQARSPQCQGLCVAQAQAEAAHPQPGTTSTPAAPASRPQSAPSQPVLMTSIAERARGVPDVQRCREAHAGS